MTKPCKYGCGQQVEWNDALNSYVTAGTTNKHNYKTCPAHVQGQPAPQPKPTDTPAKPCSSEEELKTAIVQLTQAIKDLEYSVQWLTGALQTHGS